MFSALVPEPEANMAMCVFIFHSIISSLDKTTKIYKTAEETIQYNIKEQSNSIKNTSLNYSDRHQYAGTRQIRNDKKIREIPSSAPIIAVTAPKMKIRS